MVGKTKQTGFTIVELLIVIIVIAILAAIVVVALTGVQNKAQTSKIQADQQILSKAIQAARYNTGKALKDITGQTATAGYCVTKPAGTDLATLSHTTDSCWTVYLATLQKISDASGAMVTNLVDPWNRPYYIDENEQENTATYGPCGLGKDNVAVFLRPLTGAWGSTNSISMPYFTVGC